MKITDNFTFSEFEHSDTAEAKHILNVIDTVEKRDNIVDLCVTILQPLRDAWGGPLNVTSGYRCPALNKAVGGSPTSSHLIGAAADIQPEDMKDFDKFVTFAEMFLRDNGIPFDQSIRETATLTKWWHISLKNIKGEQRRLFLAIEK